MFEDLNRFTGKRSRSSTLLIMIFFVVGTTVGLMLFEMAVKWWLG